MDRHAAIVIADHSIPSRAPNASRYWRCVDTRTSPESSSFEIGPVGNVETPREIGLADRRTVTKLVRPDFLERVSAQRDESFGCARPGHYLVAEFGELGSIVAVVTFAAPISAQMPAKNPRSCN